MRTANSMRWLLVLAAAVCVRADEGNAGVVPGGDTIEVNAMNVNAPISFVVETTPAPTTGTMKPSTPTTTEETVAPTTVTDGSVDNAGNGATVGGIVTCAFHYSLPTASNLAGELERFAAASKENKPTTAPSTPSPTGFSSGSSETDSSGSGTTPIPVPVPVDGEPSPTPTTRAPPTRTPTTTAPTGSNDGTGLRRQLQTDAGETTPVTETPTPTTKAPTPTTTAKGPVATPVPTTSTPVPASDGSTTEEPTTTTATPTPTPSEATSSDSSGSADAPSTPVPTVVTGEFTCDASFYGAWSTLGLTCGDEPLDVAQAVAQSQCLIYGGVQNLVVDINLCISVCKFPKCANGTWDYVAEDGFTSDVYDALDFGSFMSAVGKSSLLDSGVATALASLDFQTDRQCAYTAESSFAACQCENLLTPGSNSDSVTVSPALQPPVDKGLGDADHWADGLKKTGIDKAGISAAAIGTSAAVVSVAAGTAMSVAGSVMGTSAGVASGVSATASLGLAMAAVDLCQFSVMINQMNLDATPRLLQEMGKRMAPATFGFLPYGKVDTPQNEAGRRRLVDDATDLSGMERYADLIGVQVDKLFYLTLAGVMAMCVTPFVLCLVLVVLASPFVNDTRTFAKTWFDKSVGGLMMILILSEYVVGVTATFQICYLVKSDKIDDAGFYLAIFALLFFAVGTILFGIYVVKQHEDDLRDLGTKHHFEKRVHARYGPLYDEYCFESRYFFAPKLLMALLCGITTGLIFLPGLYQVVALLVIHVAFLLYLEVTRPFPQAFVQKTSSFVVIIKISALFLTLFMMTSVMAGDIPLDLRQGVGFAVIGLQVLVLVCLMIRQMYIFYITWKLKREDDEKKETAAQTRSFQPLGSSIDGMAHKRTRPQETIAILDGGRASTPIHDQNQHEQNYSPFDPTPTVQYHGHRGQEPVQTQHQQPKLRGLQTQPQPQYQYQYQQQQHHQPMQRTHTVVRHDDPTPSHNYRRHQEIDL